jgi:Concanavalin A-like lectin/glucanases superfamily
MKADSPGTVTVMFNQTRIACLAIVCCALPIGCLLFAAGTPCSVDSDCAAGESCVDGFCKALPPVVAGEGEGDRPGEGEGDRPGEGEGDPGEGEGEPGEGEGEGEVGGEGEGDVGGEGEGEPPPPTVLLCGVEHPQPAWFDLAFAKRIPIGICDATAPAGTVSGVVVPVFVIDGVIVSTDLRTDRFDILVVDHRTNTVVPYERQAIGDNGALIEVRLPPVDLRSNLSDIWIYYSNPNSADNQNIAMTYSDFQALWHFDLNFGELKSGVVGTNNVNGTVFLQEGFLGGATEHDASRQGFRFLQNLQNSQPTTVTLAQGSISALVGPPLNGAFVPGHVVMFSELGTPPSVGLDNVSTHLTIRDDNSVGFYYPSSLGVDAFTNNTAANVFDRLNFNHVAVAWTMTGSEVVVNGVSGGVRAATNQANFTLENTVLGMAENNAPGANNDTIGGRIDELRVHAVARSAAYLRAEALGYLGGLQVFGTVENRP